MRYMIDKIDMLVGETCYFILFLYSLSLFLSLSPNSKIITKF